MGKFLDQSWYIVRFGWSNVDSLFEGSEKKGKFKRAIMAKEMVRRRGTASPANLSFPP